jgi:hypothetical protein
MLKPPGFSSEKPGFLFKASKDRLEHFGSIAAAAAKPVYPKDIQINIADIKFNLLTIKL